MRRLCAAVFFFAVSLCCFSAPENVRPAEISFDMTISPAPEYKQQDAFSSLLIKNGQGKRQVRMWMLVVVNYRLPGKEKWVTGCSGELLVAVPQKTKREKQVILTGQQLLGPVKTGADMHRMLFVIPPNVVEQYMGSMGFAQVRNLPARFIFRNSSRTILGMKSSLHSQAFWAKADKLGSRGISRIETILPKDRSPWAYFAMDSFDLPYSMFEGVR